MNRRENRAAGSAGRDDAPLPGPLLLDLLAAVLEGGAPPASALQAVADGLETAGDPRAHALRLMAERVTDPAAQARAPGPPQDPLLVGLRAPGPPQDPLLVGLEDELLLAARSGLPPTALIRRAASDSRRKQAAAQARAVRRLEVMLVVPAGVCLLPAFVLLGVVPLVIGLFQG